LKGLDGEEPAAEPEDEKPVEVDLGGLGRLMKSARGKLDAASRAAEQGQAAVKDAADRAQVDRAGAQPRAADAKER